VYRIVQARGSTERPEPTRAGEAVTMRSGIRRCPDGFELPRWNRDVVRGAFVMDALDREIVFGGPW